MPERIIREGLWELLTRLDDGEFGFGEPGPSWRSTGGSVKSELYALDCDIAALVNPDEFPLLSTHKDEKHPDESPDANG
jgi:hypothetical protein